MIGRVGRVGALIAIVLCLVTVGVKYTQKACTPPGCNDIKCDTEPPHSITECADDATIYNSDIEGEIAAEGEKILSDFEGMLPEGFDMELDNAQGKIGFSTLMSELVLGLRGGGAATFFSMLMGICLLLCLAEYGYVKGGDDIISRGASIILAIPIFTTVYSLCTQISESIRTGCDFFSGLIPIMTTITAMGGGTATAVTEAAGMSLALGFVSNVLLQNLLPLISLMALLSLFSAFDEGGVIAGIASALKGIFSFILGLCSMLLPATLALQSTISSAKDSMAIRGLKYAVGGAVPVVGGTVSSVLSGLVGGAGMLSGTVGAVSFSVILVIFLVPILQLLMYRLAIKVAISLLEFVGVGSGKKMLGAMMGVLDWLIAVMSMSAVIFLLELIIFMRGVVLI